VGLVNAMGQMFNAFKEQTPLVFYSYRTDQTAAPAATASRKSPTRADRPADDQVLVARAAR